MRDPMGEKIVSERADQIGPYYRVRAKELTNVLYDKRFLADDLSRESIEGLEEYLAFLIQSYCDSAARGALLSKQVRDVAKTKTTES